MLAQEVFERMITDFVKGKQGCKVTEIAADPDIVLFAVKYSYDLVGYTSHLVENSMLVEVEYVLPNMEYRTKSFLLPEGTKVSINNED